MSVGDGVAAFERHLGGFARIFPRTTAAEIADAFSVAELTQVQLNLSALGHATIPSASELESIDLDAIAAAFTDRDQALWGISVTYNMAHPDEHVRGEATARAANYLRALSGVGFVAATLCSGTRDPENIWTKHPENGSPEAWEAMLRSIHSLIPAARAAGVLLAIEPEPGNVISDSKQAARLLDDLGTDAASIGFILDPANLLAETNEHARSGVLETAFSTLGAKTICVHAKDLVTWTDSLGGGGIVDYDLVLRLYRQLPHDVPLIIQDAIETEVVGVANRLRDAYDRARNP